METLAHQSLRGYELLERIGSGGSSAVYRAYQSTIGREVAVKVILPHFANQPDFIRRFEAEAQLIARLEHLHIVPLYDYWREPDGAYLVMRWLRGGSAKDALSQGPFGLESTVMMLNQVSAALAVAHAADVIHRDLKPSNILLDEEGNAYLGDFGIAVDLRRPVSEEASGGGLTGTPHYLAPEQARAEPVTAQTDSYSLGVTLYELLAGAHPFTGLNQVELLYKQINDPLPELRLASLPDDVQTDINAVIQQATAKDPRQRYDDALTLAAAFRRAVRFKEREATGAADLLTPREQDILRLIAAGLTNRQIAQDLYVEHSTVKWYIRQIYSKLDIRSRRQAIAWAREMRLPESDGDPTPTETETGVSVVLPALINPYKGLRAFTAADQDDFYGREALLAQLLERLQLPTAAHTSSEPLGTGRFLAVVGPSGSGKSSLVRAGLIPALWDGQLPGSERWFVVDFAPGARPLDELEVALVRVAGDQAANLREQLLRDAHGLLRAAELILPKDDSELVLVIDQFEELFSLTDDKAKRTHFLELLATAVTDPRSRVRVVITLRADYYDRPLHHPDFGQLLRRHMETVLPLKAEELEQAIVRPAEALGVGFEPGLVATIIDDVLYQPGALPLLQYALTELFEERQERTLTHQAYTAVGGATGALAKRAEELYLEQDAAGRQAVRQLFLRLVSVGRADEVQTDTRRRVPQAELLALGPDEDLLDELIDLFSAYRLLTLDHDPSSRRPTVEVAHEALLREWERLRRWLAESRADLRLQRQLARAAAEWDSAGRDSSFLIPGGARLRQFEDWRQSTTLALTPLELAYLETSVAAEEERQARRRQQARTRRNLQRALMGALAIGLLLAIGLSIFAFSRQRAAEASEQEALRQASIGLAAQALAQLESDAPERGVLLALAALEEYPYTPQAERALAQAVYGTHPYMVPDEVRDAVSAVEFSDDGRFIAGGSSVTIVVWDAAFGEIVADIKPVWWSGLPTALDWLADDSELLAAWEQLGGFANIYDLATGEERLRYIEHAGGVNSAYASPDDRLALSAGVDGTARIWLVDSGETVQIFDVPEVEVNDAIWSPDGRQVATASSDGAIRIWDVETGAEQLQIDAHRGEVTALSWSSDGARLASVGSDGLGVVWDAAAGEVLLTLKGHETLITDIAWSPDDGLLATAGADGLVRVWETRAGVEQFTLFGTASQLKDISWSPDGRRLVSVALQNARPHVWDVTTPVVRLVGYGTGENAAVQTNWPYWSPDGSWVGAGGHNDNSYRLWDPDTGRLIKSYEGVSLGFGAPNPAGTEIFLVDPPRIVNLETGEERLVSVPPGYMNEFAIEWSPDGSLLTLQTRRGRYPVYDAESLEILYMGQRRDCGFHLQGFFSPDGKYLAQTCLLSEEHTSVLITESLTGDVARELEGHTAWTYFASWSPDGSKLATSSFDGTVRVWDVATGETLTVFSGHSSWPADLDWSPDGSRLVSGDETGNVLIWDALTGGVVNGYNVGGSNFGVRWSPDGTRVLTTGYFDAPDIRPVWQSTQELIDYAYECCVFRQLTREERQQFGLLIP